MASDPNQTPTSEFETVDDTLEDILYARHTEVKSFADLEKQRGTSIPALFNQLYKFVQNPSSISVETFKRMIDTDDTIGSGIDFLTIALAARIGRYVHKNEDITKLVNKVLDEIEGGWVNAIKQILSAMWAGFSVSEVCWKNSSDGFVPAKLVGLPATTVLFETERTGELTPDGILQYQRNYNPYLATSGYLMGGSGLGMGFIGHGGRPDPFAKFGDFPFPLRTANSFNYLSIRIPTQKCVHFAFNGQGQAGNPYGRSLLRRIYKYYVMEDAINQMMMIALDRKGTSATIVFADPNTMLERPEADQGNGAADYRNNAKNGIRASDAAHGAFKNIHNDSVIVLPGKKGEIYDVEFMPQASNVTDFIAAADHCKKSKLRGLLIPALIFGAGDGSGSYSLGQEHAKTFDTLCDSINSGLEHVLLQQLVKQILAYNFPREMWEKDGLGSFSKRTLSREEIQKEMEVYEKGINTGIIDQNDLNDLNKMRETIGFEPRDTPIMKPDPLGLGSLNPGEEIVDQTGADPDNNQAAEGREAAPGADKGVDKKKDKKASKLSYREAKRTSSHGCEIIIWQGEDTNNGEWGYTLKKGGRKLAEDFGFPSAQEAYETAERIAASRPHGLAAERGYKDAKDERAEKIAAARAKAKRKVAEGSDWIEACIEVSQEMGLSEKETRQLLNSRNLLSRLLAYFTKGSEDGDTDKAAQQ